MEKTEAFLFPNSGPLGKAQHPKVAKQMVFVFEESTSTTLSTSAHLQRSTYHDTTIHTRD